MNERPPQSLAQIMAGSQRLRALDQARQNRATWTQAARKWLPSDIGAHLVAASLQDGVLILSFDSSAWAARSRYVEREVLSAAGDAAIKAVKVRVHPRGGRISGGGVSSDK